MKTSMTLNECAWHLIAKRIESRTPPYFCITPVAEFAERAYNFVQALGTKWRSTPATLAGQAVVLAEQQDMALAYRQTQEWCRVTAITRGIPDAAEFHHLCYDKLLDAVRYTFDPARAFGPYAKSIIRYTVPEAIRGHSIDQKTCDADVENLQAECGMLAAVDNEEEFQSRLDAAGVNIVERETIDRYRKGYDTAEIAALDGVTPGAIRQRKKIIREKLDNARK